MGQPVKLSDELVDDARAAAELAASIRNELVSQRESFIFETVLSDPVGQKVDQLVSYAALGYTCVRVGLVRREKFRCTTE